MLYALVVTRYSFIMTLQDIQLIANIVFLSLALIFSIIMLRAGTLYMLNTGDTAAQDIMKWRILRSIVGLIVVGLLAIAINLLGAMGVGI